MPFECVCGGGGGDRKGVLNDEGLRKSGRLTNGNKSLKSKLLLCARLYSDSYPQKPDCVANFQAHVVLCCCC